VTVPVASAEDVLVMKILAGRAKDRDDAAAILAANDGLDLAVVRDTLRLLEQALDQSDLLPELEKLLARRPSGGAAPARGATRPGDAPTPCRRRWHTQCSICGLRRRPVLRCRRPGFVSHFGGRTTRG